MYVHTLGYCAFAGIYRSLIDRLQVSAAPTTAPRLHIVLVLNAYVGPTGEMEFVWRAEEASSQLGPLAACSSRTYIIYTVYLTPCSVVRYIQVVRSIRYTE